MYEGSTYLTVATFPRACMYATIWSLSHKPNSGSLRLPPASNTALVPKISSPAPSATTITACPFRSNTRSRCGRMPRGPSVTTGTSGTRQRSTSPEHIVACTAMKPECLPISLTIPIPFGRLHRASVCAERIAACASSTAVLKPKERSRRSMSLSIVLGTPHTAMLSLSLRASSAILLAARCVPSPPTTYSWLMRCCLRKPMVLARSKEPRPEPIMVPPLFCRPTTRSSVSSIGASAKPP
mmetsp:Transcript_9623/g.22470  ORF Transcript_9623/g.22470 Transcript_9623/m.22470 type:complete len:240 (-) Transcript_9623:558-1277(-)